ncbi:hypothetical protein TBLA_0A02200 [Henningerozyma blattae CBS 6284]|uniref:mRNA-capping enzyme subunit beta n=1 Tax=Henningerozyma blattae (strain ATCC 34711 / CBS 6284 / DSM 70876 / NBRC 10599 / NRRL Y-10934 / UCD 77-7) TaxID=1071380 RepID=I2GV68_HENB6|nr:hypothetical protein TBLA_0A02200 [Tetrapisispora blattae CBS 6284]CCH58020.1 hypothetical protein TBLA_0A02200 [Tetrapisispora blattae CBS 6284]
MNNNDQTHGTSKRALSLDDLVNHDENDKQKLQKLADETIIDQSNSSVINTSISKDTESTQLPTLNNITNPTNQDLVDRTREIPTYFSSSDDDDDTGSGSGSFNFNFDNKMSFDYDEQAQKSPVKEPTTSSSSNNNTTKLVAPVLAPAAKNISSEELDPIAAPIENKNNEGQTIKENEPADMTMGPRLPNVSSVPDSTNNPTVPPNKVGKSETNNESTSTRQLTKSEQLSPEPEREVSPKNDKEVTNGKLIKEKAATQTKKQPKKNTKQKVDKIFEEKTSSRSKRNNIKKDLEILNDISHSTKPNKYKEVPIWAQKWKPSIKALQNINTNDLKNIDTSFLNIIPDDDLTKSVQDWIYATIYSIQSDLQKYIELEIKFGLIKDTKSSDRVTPPISSQAIFTNLDSHLKPNIDEVLFRELKKFIKNTSELNEHVGKFSIIESNNRDSLYRVGISTQRPRFLRMSTDMKTGRIGQFIEKRNISSLLIFSPKDSYDMKISINLEIPVPESEPPEKFKDQRPISERIKDRISYIHNDSCTRIDITNVKNLHQGIHGKDTEETFEVELEINTPALLAAFENISTNSNEYASLIRTFLNNGTIIRRKLTSLSYEIFEGQKKVN